MHHSASITCRTIGSACATRSAAWSTRCRSTTAARAAPTPAALPEFVAAGCRRSHKRDLRRGFPKSLVRDSLRSQGRDGRRAGRDHRHLRHHRESAAGAVGVDVVGSAGARGDAPQRARRARPWTASFREAVLTTPVCGGATCHIGNLTRARAHHRRHAVPEPGRRSDALERRPSWSAWSPSGTSCAPTASRPIRRTWRRSAATSRARGSELHSPAFVTLTYEQTTRAHRRAIGRAARRRRSTRSTAPPRPACCSWSATPGGCTTTRATRTSSSSTLGGGSGAWW